MRLAKDPAMQAVVGHRALEKWAASTKTLSRFEWVDRAMARTQHRRIILDRDSSESPVYGEQKGAAYNGGGTAEQWIKEGKDALEGLTAK